MLSPRIHSLIEASRRGAWFGAKASLAIFGSVFLAIYGGSGAWWVMVRVTQGRLAAQHLLEEEGGLRSLQQEFLMSLGRVVWLSAACTLLSAAIFFVCALFSEPLAEDSRASEPHPLD
jgi:hypothetical protein